MLIGVVGLLNKSSGLMPNPDGVVPQRGAVSQGSRQRQGAPLRLYPYVAYELTLLSTQHSVLGTRDERSAWSGAAAIRAYAAGLVDGRALRGT